MQFDWDDEKNQANLVKHGVSFELASYVFDDPLHHSMPDPHEDEERWQTIGIVGIANSLMTIIVVHTVTEIEGGDELVRIISARLATTHERRAYEESE